MGLLAVAAGGCGKKHAPASGSPPAAKPAAADWLTTERDIEPTDEMKKLIARYEKESDDTSRQWTLAAMGRLGEPAAVVWLARLGASDPRFGRWAEDALGAITNRHAGLELGDVATSSGPPRVRVAAIRALAASGDLAQAAQLSALVADGKQPLQVRQASALALGLMRRPGGVPALATALQGALDDKKMTGQQFRVTVLQALGRIGTAEARDVLEAHAKRDLADTERKVVEGTLADLKRDAH